MRSLHSIIDSVTTVDILNSTPVHFAKDVFFKLIDAIWNWSGFNIEPAISDNSSVFGLAQFLSTLALLVVVFNVSDFRYRYRLFVMRHDIRRIAILTASAIARAVQRSLLKVIESIDLRPPYAAARRSWGIVSV